MESFISTDNLVAKYVHADGSETAIKHVLSQSTVVKNDKPETIFQDRNKYSVFASVSLGCFLSCPFCHLTIKHCPYKKLTARQILANLKEALVEELHRKPELASRYIKLCWMGMGDALPMHAQIRDLSIEYLDWVMENKLAAGLDSVDLSTVLPVGGDWTHSFSDLNKQLAKYPSNPLSHQLENVQQSNFKEYNQRSKFRLFFSLHSANQITRNRMVPKALPLTQALPLLKEYAESGLTLILHQLFVQGLNDSLTEVNQLLDFMQQLPPVELRVLRYNFCNNSPYQEWPEIETALKRLAQQAPMLKVQESAGSEIQAACGQFLVVRPNRQI